MPITQSLEQLHHSWDLAVSDLGLFSKLKKHLCTHFGNDEADEGANKWFFFVEASKHFSVAASLC
jgi:hypothetical protein